MQNKIALVIPAAGRGSRFAKVGENRPKPLLELEGRPFFWWAVESVRRAAELRQLIFVVLQEHVTEFSIDQEIRNYYPDATVIAISGTTGGAAETAKIGIEGLKVPGAVAVNDCDHAFICPGFSGLIKALQGSMEGALMCFRSTDPAYSYLKLGLNHEVIGTVEKQVASPFAIAGCYLFASSERFHALYDHYRQVCPYRELFLSGMFNLLAQRHSEIGMLELERHCSFGTPEEKTSLSREMLAPFLAWK
ncbi:MAG: NTP transferase domain-containing protein [Pseudomonadota bacterium]|nr:NTP transferase domain-containing protein [Pseudomonadota bacterium]